MFELSLSFSEVPYIVNEVLDEYAEAVLSEEILFAFHPEINIPKNGYLKTHILDFTVLSKDVYSSWQARHFSYIQKSHPTQV